MADGFRGYIVSAPVRGSHYPQRVQNLVIRDYAARSGLGYRLSLTEYAMPGSSMMFESLLGELDAVDGIILFSLFTLPRTLTRRHEAYRRIIAAGKSLHAALEQLTLTNANDAAAWDQMIAIDAALPATPFAGRYEKNGAPLGADSATLLAAFGVTPESPHA